MSDNDDLPSAKTTEEALIRLGQAFEEYCMELDKAAVQHERNIRAYFLRAHRRLRDWIRWEVD